MTVTSTPQEQLTGTEAKISCTVEGLSQPLDAVQWTKLDGSAVISGQDGLSIEPGSFIGTSQTTVLTVSGSQNNRDTNYNCVITANEHGVEDRSTAVNLKIFCKYFKISKVLELRR